MIQTCIQRGTAGRSGVPARKVGGILRITNRFLGMADFLLSESCPRMAVFHMRSLVPCEIFLVSNSSRYFCNTLLMRFAMIESSMFARKHRKEGVGGMRALVAVAILLSLAGGAAVGAIAYRSGGVRAW